MTPEVTEKHKACADEIRGLAHIAETPAGTYVSWHDSWNSHIANLHGDIVERTLARHFPDDARLRKAAEQLVELDWTYGYELSDRGYSVLDKALSTARQAIKDTHCETSASDLSGARSEQSDTSRSRGVAGETGHQPFTEERLRAACQGLVDLLDAHGWGDGPALREARAALGDAERGEEKRT